MSGPWQPQPSDFLRDLIAIDILEPCQDKKIEYLVAIYSMCQAEVTLIKKG